MGRRYNMHRAHGTGIIHALLPQTLVRRCNMHLAYGILKSVDRIKPEGTNRAVGSAHVVATGFNPLK